LRQPVARSAGSPVTGWLTFGDAGARPGSTSASVGVPRTSWFEPVDSSVTTQTLVASNVPSPGDVTAYVGTASGYVYAYAADGYVRWGVDLGRLAQPCSQISDGFGVTGTPVIDPATRTLYVADAFGRLHALDLATGRERAGWPVVLFRDYRRELVWGALLLADGSVYAGTGAYCDEPMEGKLFRVDTSTRRVSSWTSVPASLGGGGGIWGWGGPAYDPASDSILVVTGNAFEGGSNTGKSFTESAGYGEHLVVLSPDLRVRAASAPGLAGFADVDFVGSPVVFDGGSCGRLVAAQAKNGMLFGWRAAAVSSGPAWSLALQKADAAAPLLTQPVWSARYRSLYIVTTAKLVRVSLGADCRPKIAWQATLGASTLYPSPTVAGNLVWLGLPWLSGKLQALLGFDPQTGRVRVRQRIAGVSFAPPSVFGGVLYLGSMHGFTGGQFPVAHGRPASALPEYASDIGGGRSWQSREDGVYATDDAGRHWHRIYPGYATRVVRLSATAGVIAVGSPAPACGCSPTRLRTDDGGRTWKSVPALGGSFQGRGPLLYWWKGGSLFLLRGKATTSQRVASADGTIVSAANTAGGVAALVDRPGRPPQVIVAAGAQARVVTLPAGSPADVVRSISTTGSTVVVRGDDDSSPGAGPDPTVEWRSRDGGATWTIG
jgi:PQQ-like domain